MEEAAGEPSHTGSPQPTERLFTSAALHISTYQALFGSGSGRPGPRTHSILLPGTAGATLLTAEGAWVVDPTCFVLLRADSPYRIEGPPETRGHLITLRPDLLLKALGATASIAPDRIATSTVSVSSRTYLLKQLLVERLQRHRDPNPAEVEALALQVVTEAFASPPEHPPSRPPHPATAEGHRRCVDAARLHLGHRLTEPLRVPSVAASVGVSPFHLCRIFKACSGVSIHRYLTQLRLRLALEGVADTSPSLMRLAIDLGFSSHSHFSFLFGREYGIPPTAFRRAVAYPGLHQAIQATSRPQIHVMVSSRGRDRTPSHPPIHLFHRSE
jgi:AraC-like DNA-binding protein